MKTEQLLCERAKTHGSFSDVATIAQQLKDSIRRIRQTAGKKPEPVLDEALDMIASKIGRIASGNSFEPDHWFDIMGYAKLAHDHVLQSAKSAESVEEKEAEEPQPQPQPSPLSCEEIDKHVQSIARRFHAGMIGGVKMPLGLTYEQFDLLNDIHEFSLSPSEYRMLEKRVDEILDPAVGCIAHNRGHEIIHFLAELFIRGLLSLEQLQQIWSAFLDDYRDANGIAKL